MGTNFHNAWIDKPTLGYTVYTAVSMNPALASLDQAITYLKNIILGCGGAVTWNAGTLSWDSEIEIRFNTSAGLAIRNYIAAGSIALSSDEFAYIDLSETNNALLTVAKLGIPDEESSNFIAYNRMVLGYRESISNNFYPTSFLQPLLAIAQVSYLDGREQEITCADEVTIDWEDGATAYMVFDRATVAITLSNGSNGKVYRLRLTQDVTGGRVVTWVSTIKWRGGVAPTLTTTGNYSDWITFVRSNDIWYGDATLNFPN